MARTTVAARRHLSSILVPTRRGSRGAPKALVAQYTYMLRNVPRNRRPRSDPRRPSEDSLWSFRGPRRLISLTAMSNRRPWRITHTSWLARPRGAVSIRHCSWPGCLRAGVHRLRCVTDLNGAAQPMVVEAICNGWVVLAMISELRTLLSGGRRVRIQAG